MAKITDYRTESQKKQDARREKAIRRYEELRAEGLTHYRACVITAREQGWSESGVRLTIKRYKAEQESKTN